MKQRPLDIVARTLPSGEGNPAFRRMRNKTLVNDTAVWLGALDQVAHEAGIRCRSRIASLQDKPQPTDLLVHAHYRLDPSVGAHILEAAETERFRLLLILSYMDLPIADWATGGLHLGLLRPDHRDSIILPDKVETRIAEQSLTCRSMTSFNRREMLRLLQSLHGAESIN